jgi:hypothetical protein
MKQIWAILILNPHPSECPFTSFFTKTKKKIFTAWVDITLNIE